MVLSALIAIASAAPSGLHGLPLTYTYAAAQPSLTTYNTHLGYAPTVYAAAPAAHHTIVEYQPEYHVEAAPILAKVEHVPTAVSHQSSTVVHSKAAVVTPIVAAPIAYAHAPAYHTKIVAASPIAYAHKW